MSASSRLGQHSSQHGEPYLPGVPRKGVWVRSECYSEHWHAICFELDKQHLGTAQYESKPRV